PPQTLQGIPLLCGIKYYSNFYVPATNCSSTISSIVIFHSQMGNQVLALQITECVLKLHQLNKKIVFRIQAGGVHGTFEIKAQPLLNAAHAAPLGQIHEKNEIQDDWSRQNTVAAKEIDLDLHGIAEPSVYVDIVPTFFIVAARRIVMNPHLMGEILVQVR